MSKNLIFLFISAICIQSGNLLFTATSTLISLSLIGSDSISILPIFVSIISSLIFIIPVSLLMALKGRKIVFLSGYVFAIISLVFFLNSINSKNFIQFIIGAFFLGISNSIGSYYRFAGVDVSSPDYRANAISFILAGGVISALIGPNLYKWGNQFFNWEGFLSGFLFQLPLYLLGLTLLFFVKIPKAHSVDLTKSRKTIQLFRETSLFPIISLSVLSAVIMIFIMTATPLGMKFHHHNSDSITTIIQYHVLGMYVPSFFTGSLIKRFGIKKIMLLGIFFFFICIGINFIEHSFYHFAFSLILLGVGWNFLFISSTTLLTEKIESKDQPRAQALNDFLATGFGALAVAVSGKIHSEIGWVNLNLFTLPLIVLALFIILKEPPK